MMKPSNSSWPPAPPTRADAFLSLFGQEPAAAESAYIAFFERLVKYFEGRGAKTAEDLAQETIRRALLKFTDGTGENYPICLFPYLFGIARNVLHEHWKNGQRRECYMPGEILDELPCVHGSYDHALLLRQCLAVLKLDERELLIRYHSDQREELERELKVDRNNLRVRVHRITQRLRDKLQVDHGAKLSRHKRVALGHAR